jgi:hypothetical protein
MSLAFFPTVYKEDIDKSLFILGGQSILRREEEEEEDEKCIIENWEIFSTELYSISHKNKY